jgi:hypothetical protein
VGKHDFTSFCKHEHEVGNRVCTLVPSEWTTCPGGMIYTDPLEYLLSEPRVYGEVRDEAPSLGIESSHEYCW